MPVITLGSGANQLQSSRVIDWDEAKSRVLPRKTPVGASGNVEKDAGVGNPRTITLTARLTSTQKSSLKLLQAEHAWQPLQEDATLIDYVWIESTEARWRGTEDYSYPWLTAIGLVCSNT